MKKLKYSKKMVLDTQSFLKSIENNYNKLNKEYSKNMLKLLENIAIGENLDLKMLKEKYLNSSKEETNVVSEEVIITPIFSNITSSEEQNDNSSENNDEIILDKITLNNKDYYYENKQLGRIYNSSSKIVGEYKDNKFYIFENN